MRWMNRFHPENRLPGVVVLTLMLTCAAGAADNPPTPNGAADKESPASERIAQLIEQLGSDDFGAREKAQSELAQAGLEAYDALHAAQSHHDPEIALRARYLVQSMRQTVRWFADTDSAKVIAILKEYGDLQEAERRNRVDRLAALENGSGVVPLIRLARFETSDALAKYAALQVLELPSPKDDAAKTALVKNITSIVGSSKRPSAVWLRLYSRTLADPLSTLAEWDQAAQAEHAVLDGKNAERTRPEIVRDLYRFQVELLGRLDKADDAQAPIRRMFVLLDGSAGQLQEMVDWLFNRRAWAAAVEVMQKFDSTVQENARLLYRLAGAYQELRQPDQAEAAAKKALALKPDSLEDHLVIAHELEDISYLAKWAEAEYRLLLESATPGSRHDFAARFKLSEMLHDHLQELPAAEMLKPVCDLVQKDENGNAAKEAWYRLTGLPAEAAIARMNYFLACHDREQGDHAKEKEHLKTAVDAYFKDADVLIAMYRLPHPDDAWKALTKEKIESVTTEFRRDVDEGRMTVETADSEHSRSDALRSFAIACNQYAWLVGNTFGDYQEAVKLSQESVKICEQLPEMKPNCGGYLDTLGRAYFGAGDVVNAVKHQAMAVALNPASGQIRRQLEFFQKEAVDRGIKLPDPESTAIPMATPTNSSPPTPTARSAPRPANVTAPPAVRPQSTEPR
jgi:tetratricopeptide (TPR) repeat protein